MTHQKMLRGPCQRCGKTFAYPAHLVGTTGICPLCGQATELLLEAPPPQPVLERRTIIWTVATILVLVLGLAGAMFALNKLRNLRNQQQSGKTPVVLYVELYEALPDSHRTLSA
jgi:hypothetical protein